MLLRSRTKLASCAKNASSSGAPPTTSTTVPRPALSPISSGKGLSFPASRWRMGASSSSSEYSARALRTNGAAEPQWMFCCGRMTYCTMMRAHCTRKSCTRLSAGRNFSICCDFLEAAACSRSFRAITITQLERKSGSAWSSITSSRFAAMAPLTLPHRRPQLARKLQHHQRVIDASVIAGNDVEVIEAEPITRPVLRLGHENDRFGFVTHGSEGNDSAAAQLSHSDLWLDISGLRRFDGPGIGFCFNYRLFARAPSESLVVVRDASDRIGRRPYQVSLAVAVEVYGVTAVTARQELRQADRAGGRSAQSERIEARFTREQQILLQLAAKEIRARRVLKRQGREDIENPEGAGNPAIQCLDTYGGDNDLFRHAIFARGACDDARVLLPEADPAVNTLRVDVGQTKFVPGPRRAWRRHGANDGGARLHLREKPA